MRTRTVNFGKRGGPLTSFIYFKLCWELFSRASWNFGALSFMNSLHCQSNLISLLRFKAFEVLHLRDLHMMREWASEKTKFNDNFFKLCEKNLQDILSPIREYACNIYFRQTKLILIVIWNMISNNQNVWPFNKGDQFFFYNLPNLSKIFIHSVLTMNTTKDLKNIFYFSQQFFSASVSAFVNENLKFISYYFANCYWYFVKIFVNLIGNSLNIGLWYLNLFT